MPAATRFTLYDLVVDLIPGVVAILLSFAIVGQQRLRDIVQVYGAALPAVALLAIGYVVGRILHSLSNYDAVERTGIAVYNVIPLLDSLEEKDRRFSARLAHVLSEGDDETLEYAVAERAQESIFDRFDVTTPSPDGSNDEPSTDSEGIGAIPERRYARYLSDTITYRKQGLSWKYGILATFFRNMWVVLVGASCFYFLTRWGAIDRRVVAISAVFLVSGLICLQQRFKFKRRQIRTMLNEIALADTQ
ncbi:MAG: hypothetical protein ABEJ85_00135 [Haloarculaceae archaeon]